MKANFYEMTFFEDNVSPFVRTGMAVEMANNIITINGLGKYRVFKRPEEIGKNDIIEEKFIDYHNSTPWLGQENDGIMYLYRAQIDENSLNLVEVDKDYSYVIVNSKENERITVLNGKLFFRNFINGDQSALIRLEECTMIRIEKEEGFIMVEFVDGKFISR